MKLNISTRQIALMATLAALYTVISIFVKPIQIPVGIPGLEISPAALFATILGVILGPYLGTASAVIGTTAAWALTGGSPFGLPFLLSPPLNAFVSGAIFYKRWKMAVPVFVVLSVAFLFTPPVLALGDFLGGTQIVIWVLWDKILAMLLILLIAFLSKRLSIAHGAALLFILAFIGNEADNIWGSFIFAWPVVYNGIFGMPIELVQGSFLASPFLYPAIRLIQAFFAMLIAVPLIGILSRRNWLWSNNHILNQTDKPVVPPPPSETPPN
jgi:hypothetical protein